MLEAKMIPREELFNPVKILSVKISPSGVGGKVREGLPISILRIEIVARVKKLS